MTTPAAPSAFAVIGLRGSTLRYAEIVRPSPESTATAPKLRRLGACDFDFDAEQTVLGSEETARLAVIERALRQVFHDSVAEALVVTAHPTSTINFFSALPDALDGTQRREQLRQEAALMADVSASQPVRIRAVPTRAQRLPSGLFQWHHVLYVAETVHARLTRLARALEVSAYDIVDTRRATSSGLRATSSPTDETTHLALVVGTYAEHTECALCRDGAWIHGLLSAGTTPEETDRVGRDALQQLGMQPAQIFGLHIYGTDTRPERTSILVDSLRREPALLDFTTYFGRSIEADPTEMAAFAPILGAALR